MKLGRNDPCGCGSGKKFKNCCQGKNIAPRPSSPPEAELARLGSLFNAGQIADVESQARLLVEQYPNCAPAWKLLGASRHLQSKDGLPALRKAVELCPTDAFAHSNLGNALKDLGQLDQAVIAYRHALKLKPELAGIHYNLGLTFMDLGQLDNAIASYRQALALKPDYAEALCDLGNALKDLGQLENALSSYRRALELKPDFTGAHSNLLFTLNYSANYTPEYCLEKARQFGRMAAHKTPGRFTAWQCAIPPERLRVGFVSGDLRNHPVGYFMESLVTQLDPRRIELFAYPTHAKEDALTARIKPRFAAWRPLSGLSDEAAARLIHADGIHVLLDVSGHTRHNRLPVFAWKPAPVQVSWPGYFATTGMAEMDYFLADRIGVPDASRKYFTESVYYLPDTRLCFTPPQAELPVAALPALTNGNITFGCFQNLPKVGDDVLSVWAKIFAALPNARLRIQCPQLSEPTQLAQFIERAQLHGINAARVKAFGLMPREAYLAAHADVDMLLDTFPFPGGTTTCEALWMGVPTLTLAGETMLARQGTSILSAAGLSGWVATNQDDYVAKAVALGSNWASLAELRARLRAQVLASPLFDAPLFARGFATAMYKMYLHQQNHPQQ